MLASFKLGAQTFDEQLKIYLDAERTKAVEANKVIRQAMKKRKSDDGAVAEAAKPPEGQLPGASSTATGASAAAPAAAAPATAPAEKPAQSPQDHLAKLRAGKDGAKAS